MNAFLNASGGTIYFGIEDDGIVSGLLLDRGARDDLRLRLDAGVTSFGFCFLGSISYPGQTFGQK